MDENVKGLHTPGNLWIDEKSNQIRYHTDESQWIQPMSTYDVGNSSNDQHIAYIKRGQPVSIGALEDLIPDEKITEDPCVVLTTPGKHKVCIGIALEPGDSKAKENSFEKIHVLSKGKIEYKLNDDRKNVYQPPFTGEDEDRRYVWTYDDVGKIVYVSNKNPGALTLNLDEAYYDGGNIISVGTIADAPLKIDGFNGQRIIIEVQTAGDVRGITDSTEFAVKLERINNDSRVITTNKDLLLFVKIYKDLSGKDVGRIIYEENDLDNEHSPVGAFYYKNESSHVNLAQFSGQTVKCNRLGLITGNFQFKEDEIGKELYLLNDGSNTVSTSAPIRTFEYKIGIVFAKNKVLLDCRFPKFLKKFAPIGTIKPAYKDSVTGEVYADPGYIVIDTKSVRKIKKPLEGDILPTPINKNGDISPLIDTHIDFTNLVKYTRYYDLFEFTVGQSSNWTWGEYNQEYSFQERLDNDYFTFKNNLCYTLGNGEEIPTQIKYEFEGTAEDSEFLWPEFTINGRISKTAIQIEKFVDSRSYWDQQFTGSKILPNIELDFDLWLKSPDSNNLNHRYELNIEFKAKGDTPRLLRSEGILNPETDVEHITTTLNDALFRIICQSKDVEEGASYIRPTVILSETPQPAEYERGWVWEGDPAKNPANPVNNDIPEYPGYPDYGDKDFTLDYDEEHTFTFMNDEILVRGRESFWEWLPPTRTSWLWYNEEEQQVGFPTQSTSTDGDTQTRTRYEPITLEDDYNLGVIRPAYFNEQTQTRTYYGEDDDGNPSWSSWSQWSSGEEIEWGTWRRNIDPPKWEWNGKNLEGGGKEEEPTSHDKKPLENYYTVLVEGDYPPPPDGLIRKTEEWFQDSDKFVWGQRSDKDMLVPPHKRFEFYFIDSLMTTVEIIPEFYLQATDFINEWPSDKIYYYNETWRKTRDFIDIKLEGTTPPPFNLRIDTRKLSVDTFNSINDNLFFTSVSPWYATNIFCEGIQIQDADIELKEVEPPYTFEKPLRFWISNLVGMDYIDANGMNAENYDFSLCMLMNNQNHYISPGFFPVPQELLNVNLKEDDVPETEAFYGYGWTIGRAENKSWYISIYEVPPGTDVSNYSKYRGLNWPLGTKRTEHTLEIPFRITLRKRPVQHQHFMINQLLNELAWHPFSDEQKNLITRNKLYFVGDEDIKHCKTDEQIHNITQNATYFDVKPGEHRNPKDSIDFITHVGPVYVNGYKDTQAVQFFKETKYPVNNNANDENAKMYKPISWVYDFLSNTVRSTGKVSMEAGLESTAGSKKEDDWEFNALEVFAFMPTPELLKVTRDDPVLGIKHDRFINLTSNVNNFNSSGLPSFTASYDITDNYKLLFGEAYTNLELQSYMTMVGQALKETFNNFYYVNHYLFDDNNFDKNISVEFNELSNKGGLIKATVKLLNDFENIDKRIDEITSFEETRHRDKSYIQNFIGRSVTGTNIPLTSNRGVYSAFGFQNGKISTAFSLAVANQPNVTQINTSGASANTFKPIAVQGWPGNIEFTPPQEEYPNIVTLINRAIDTAFPTITTSLETQAQIVNLGTLTNLKNVLSNMFIRLENHLHELNSHTHPITSTDIASALRLNLVEGPSWHQGYNNINININFSTNPYSLRERYSFDYNGYKCYLYIWPHEKSFYRVRYIRNIWTWIHGNVSPPGIETLGDWSSSSPSSTYRDVYTDRNMIMIIHKPITINSNVIWTEPNNYNSITQKPAIGQEYDTQPYGPLVLTWVGLVGHNVDNNTHFPRWEISGGETRYEHNIMPRIASSLIKILYDEAIVDRYPNNTTII